MHELRAPVTGTVQQLAVHTLGGVVTPAQALMVLVPTQQDMTAKVMIPNKDTGFVHRRQSVRITSNRQAPVAYFPAHIQLKQDRLMVDGKQMPLTPGLNITAEIKTGGRSVLDYLLSPIQKTLNESAAER